MAEFMNPPEPGEASVRDAIRRRSLLFGTSCGTEVDDLVELRVDGDRIGVRICGDRMSVEDGALRDAGARIEIDSEAMFEAMMGQTDDAGEVCLSRATVEGDRDAALRLINELNFRKTLAADAG